MPQTSLLIADTIRLLSIFKLGPKKKVDVLADNNQRSECPTTRRPRSAVNLQRGRHEEFAVSGSLQMNLVCTLSLAAALSAVVVRSSPHSEEQDPLTAPTRDVDITYQITRPGRPAILERRRWSASQHSRRVDGPDKSATIFDQSRGNSRSSMRQITRISRWRDQRPSGCPRKKGRR